MLGPRPFAGPSVLVISRQPEGHRPPSGQAPATATATAAMDLAPLVCRPESCLDRFRGGIDQLTGTGDSGRNLLVAVPVGSDELGRLGVSQDVDP